MVLNHNDFGDLHSGQKFHLSSTVHEKIWEEISPICTSSVYCDPICCCLGNKCFSWGLHSNKIHVTIFALPLHMANNITIYVAFK